MLSASNEWPLNNNSSNNQIREGDQDDDDEQQIRSLNINKKDMMLGTEELGGGGSARVVMEKPSQEQIQQEQHAPLKCPRCDSTNTKFCYYNNYSLSQPRHFCKACKRYWTRGGTLRTVPVGGGCRKNKRIRRVISPNFSSPATNSSSSNNNSSSNIITTTESTSCAFNNSHQSLNPNGGGGGGGSHLMNNSPLLYGLPTNLASSSPHEAIINGFPFSSSYDNNHHHLNGISGGLGFSSAGGMMLGDHRNGGYSTNTTTTPKQILHDLISNSSPFHGSNSNPSNSTTTTLPSMSMSSLLTSTLHHQHQQKFNFETLFPYDLDLQIKEVGSHENEGVYIKDDSVKLECQVQNGYDQIHENHHNHHQQPMGESDPSINMWNANNSNGNSIGVNWLDPNYSNLGSSSVPSLI